VVGGGYVIPSSKPASTPLFVTCRTVSRPSFGRGERPALRPAASAAAVASSTGSSRYGAAIDSSAIGSGVPGDEALDVADGVAIPIPVDGVVWDDAGVAVDGRAVPVESLPHAAVNNAIATRALTLSVTLSPG
jgi:hypothetical protein